MESGCQRWGDNPELGAVFNRTPFWWDKNYDCTDGGGWEGGGIIFKNI